MEVACMSLGTGYVILELVLPLLLLVFVFPPLIMLVYHTITVLSAFFTPSPVQF